MLSNNLVVMEVKMKGLSDKWQKLILWLTGYLNIIAFVIAGGYFYAKTESESVKKSAKTVFVFVLLFTLISIATSILSNFFAIGDNYDVTRVITKITYVVNILKAILFVVFAVLDLCGINVLPIKSEKQKDETLDIQD